jgi:WhiB family redox-sensing transcriptional regulator
MSTRYGTAPGDWAEHAACRTTNTDMHLGTHPWPKRIATCRHICHHCPVLNECREWALTTPDPATEHMAGGLTPRERQRIRQTNARHPAR